MVLGILAMVIGGASVPDDVDVDPTQDVVFSGSEGQITVTPFDYLNVYVQADSCDAISLSVLDDGESYAYFYDFCDPNSPDYGMSYYYPEGWIHVADIAPLDDERRRAGPAGNRAPLHGTLRALWLPAGSDGTRLRPGGKLARPRLSPSGPAAPCRPRPAAGVRT